MKVSTSSTPSGSEGERSLSKKRRKDKKQKKDEYKRKERKKHRKKRQYSSGSSESSSSDEEERSKKRRLLKEAKRILKSHKKPKTNASVNLSPKEELFSSRKVLTEDDYYEKNKEFSTWLRDERGLYFSNLSADDTRRLFLDFMQAWNSGTVSNRLYGGIQSAARTDHKWNIKVEGESFIDKEEELQFTKKLEKIQKKKFRNEQKDLIDELLPKATGRDRLIENKLLRKQEMRTREESPELLKDQDIMGGSDDFKQRLEMERTWRKKKVMERNEALKEKQLAADQRETAAMDQFKALLNVSGGKITIPKRVQ
ncbi:hypothetical protein GOP47_0001937 [Adiantum capillus-veneris]|uniref:Uncharacterized protein n=1 Tax=Adiantum capillus-veneris TaxID=13818 RepID=A0A9D4ZNQ9_ADICA|nr:hypothetical protein GOP47_0001937 [Adiantum capillus-veneris]